MRDLEKGKKKSPLPRRHALTTHELERMGFSCLRADTHCHFPQVVNITLATLHARVNGSGAAEVQAKERRTPNPEANACMKGKKGGKPLFTPLPSLSRIEERVSIVSFKSPPLFLSPVWEIVGTSSLLLPFFSVMGERQPMIKQG